MESRAARCFRGTALVVLLPVVDQKQSGRRMVKIFIRPAGEAGENRLKRREYVNALYFLFASSLALLMSLRTSGRRRSASSRLG